METTRQPQGVWFPLLRTDHKLLEALALYDCEGSEIQELDLGLYNLTDAAIETTGHYLEEDPLAGGKRTPMIRVTLETSVLEVSEMMPIADPWPFLYDRIEFTAEAEEIINSFVDTPILNQVIQNLLEKLNTYYMSAEDILQERTERGEGTCGDR